METHLLYDEVAATIAQLNPAKVLLLKAPVALQQQLNSLLEKSKTTQLSTEEKEQLDHYIVLERLIRLAKIHAQQQLSLL
ncbi:MAG: hypothetical protein JNM36_05535 [Chitinophagales bacterium]|nr:hypothetical protein [Chitinophagales bacterium]